MVSRPGYRSTNRKGKTMQTIHIDDRNAASPFVTDPDEVHATLYQWSNVFPGSPVHAALFALMMQAAQPVVVEYLSDLYHDAISLADDVQGETGFWYAVRPSGTNLGYSAQVQRDISKIGTVRLYWVEVTKDERGVWSASFYRVPDAYPLSRYDADAVKAAAQMVVGE